MPSSQPNRRQFLQGEAARRALEQALYESRVEAGLTDPSQLADRIDNSLLEFHCQAMACNFSVFLNRSEAQYTAAHAIDALESLHPLEQQLTVYRDTSEVCEINREAFARALVLEDNLFGLLQRAQTLSQETSGAFDITAGPLSRVWGFFRREGQVPDQAALREACQAVGYQHYSLDESTRSIRFHRPGVELNLGAIGKGFALDQLGRRLASQGVSNFLIQGGQSSVLTSGQRADQDEHGGWPVGLRHPIRPQLQLGEIRLNDQALATSGSGNQFFRHQGKRFGHVLDPRSGWPVEGVLSATVVSRTAEDADALATAFFVMGYDDAARYCERREDLAAVFVLPERHNGHPQIKLIGGLEFRES